MDIFKRKERAEEMAFVVEKTEEETAKMENREKTIQEMIENDHPLVQEIKDPHWIQNAVEKFGNMGSLKKNTQLACEKTAEKTGFEPKLVMEIHEELQKIREKEREDLEKEILEKRRRGM
ncbi:hypothetical protein KJ751_01430 [Patescibacteria group bacterium]|nr:hypothetical protein [Patescibacteria group bacterium]